MAAISRERLQALHQREEASFRTLHPRSFELSRRAQGSLLAGVPMPWMLRWTGGFPLFVAEGRGARFRDVDDRTYVDFCLGDTGAMSGHAPEATVMAVRRQVERGLTFMLPTEDANAVAENLAERFGLPYWQFTLSATDANRFAIRWARALTGRPKILVFNWCYHGTVDETFATLIEGRTVARSGNVGPPVDLSLTTRVVEFNDIPALETALREGDVACVLAEPVMTNIGIVHPQPGFHEALRELTRRYSALLILDETHTISAGPGGYTAEYGLEPDILTVGKPIGGGVSAGAYGVSAEIAVRIIARTSLSEADTGGVGGTLAANALSLAAMRATLTDVLTPEAYRHATSVAERFEAGVRDVLTRRAVPFSVSRLGTRVEYIFRPEPPKNGSEGAAGQDAELDAFLHLYCLNRGILMTPFHNMALMSRDTSAADVDLHTEVFAAAIDELLG